MPSSRTPALETVDVAGESEIYATSARDSRVFVFALSDGIPISVIGDRTQTTDVQSVSNAGVALLAALVTGNTETGPEQGEENGFVVGLGNGANIPNALGFLTTLLVGASGGEDPVESSADGDVAPNAATQLNGLISGIEDAMRLFQQRMAGPQAGEGIPPEAEFDFRGLLDKVYIPFAQTSTTLAEVMQVAGQTVARAGKMSPDGGTGMDGIGLGIEATLESVRHAGYPAAASLNRCLDSAFHSQGEIPLWLGPVNDSSRLDAPTGNPLPPPAWDRPEWPGVLAGAFMLGGFWRIWEVEDSRSTLLPPSLKRRTIY